MTTHPLFLQIHLLTPYHAALLNRDDVGRAKRLPLGGASRIRVSSQCLKRHWREVVSDWSLQTLPGATQTIRSRKIISREVARPLLEEGFDADQIILVLDALKVKLLGESKAVKAEKANKKGKSAAGVDDPQLQLTGDVTVGTDDKFAVLDTKQVIVLGRPEIEFIRASARHLLEERPNDFEKAVEAHLKNKETLANLEAMRLAAGLDAALFGRMVTSDILARGDAAVHVAHALTVHAEEAEPDYFVAIDDLTREAGELGTGLIQTSELTSGLFYSYIVVDVPLLVSNLEGCEAKDWGNADRTLAAGVVERLVHLVATTSPGAKLGSTAPYGYADLVLVEAGRRQPRSLMTAFHSPVRKADARTNAVAALAGHLQRFDDVYGRDEDRRVVSLLDVDAVPAEPVSGGLASLAAWAAERVRAEAS